MDLGTDDLVMDIIYILAFLITSTLIALIPAGELSDVFDFQIYVGCVAVVFTTTTVLYLLYKRYT